MRSVSPVTFLAVVLIATSSLSSAQLAKAQLLTLLPQPVDRQGWSMVDSARQFQGSELYRFIDGGADLFLEFGFRQAVTAEYESGGGSITLEIYEMSNSAAAYGIYSIRAGSEGAAIDVGEEGRVYSYYIMFWKGPFYVSVAGSDSDANCRMGFETIAKSVARNITLRGERPGIMGLLPKEARQRECYVRGPIGLSTMNLFEVNGLYPAEEGAVGIFEDHTIIILLYSGAAEAQRHFQEIRHDLMSGKRFSQYRFRDRMATVRDRDLQTICIMQSGSHLLISIASSEGTAKMSCQETIRSLEQR